MNANRYFWCSLLAVALLVSSCGGQPEIPTQGQLPAPQQEQLDSPTPEPAHPVMTSPVDFVIEPILFDFDSAMLRPDGIRHINQAVVFFKKHRPDAKFVIEGHTDARGTEEYNLDLGCRRARAVREALIERGFPAEQLRVVSYAADRPAALGNNEAAWSQNRRVAYFQQFWERELNCDEP